MIFELNNIGNNNSENTLESLKCNALPCNLESSEPKLTLEANIRKQNYLRSSQAACINSIFN